MNATHLWQSVLKDLQMRLPRSDFETWLQDTAITAFAEGVVTVSTPNSFAKQWLEGNARDLICRSLSNVLGYDAQIRIVSAEARKPSSTGAKNHAESAPRKGANEVGAVMAGKLRDGWQPLYNEMKLLAPILGSDALALYSILLLHRHGGGKYGNMVGCAWPGDRTLCKMLGWSWGTKPGLPRRLNRNLTILEAAELIHTTTVGEMIQEGKLTEEQAAEMLPRSPDHFRRRKRVVLVHDPPPEEDLLPRLEEIGQAVETAVEELKSACAAAAEKRRENRERADKEGLGQPS